MLLEGKTALVTGASRAEGADVAVNFAGSSAKAEEVKEAIIKMGRKAVAIQADVKDVSSVASMVEEVKKTFGRIDILVNNAGVTRDGLLMRMKDEDWETVIDTNLRGVFQCTKAVSKIMMKQRYGRIVNMASVVGLVGNAGQANYAASKAGVIGFSKSVARELASRGITVNMVAPGCIDTDMTAVLSDKVREAMLADIPLARVGKPEDVANAVAFLVSDEAAYITGQVINVDGGMVM